MLIGEIYQIVENPKQGEKEHYAIEIIDGVYQDLVYQYGKVQFVEGKPEINFERTIRRCPEGMEVKELLKDSELNNLMGDILVEMLEEQVGRQEK